MRRTGIVSLLTTHLLLAGCPLLPERPPPPALHDLGPPRAAAEGAAPWSAVTVAAPEWLQDPLIRYRLLYTQPTQIRFYTLDRWVAPPPDLLAHRLAANRAAQGYELKIELQGFEQVFEQPNRTRVWLRLHADAVHPVSGRCVAQKVFQWARPTPSADAAGAVDAFSGLVTFAIRQISDWMAQLPPPEYRAHLEPPAAGR